MMSYSQCLSVNFFSALNILGVPTQFDPNDGTMAGGAVIPTDLDPINQTRSDARRAYFDPYVGRPNMHVITGRHVTRIVIDGIAAGTSVNTSTSEGNINGEGPTADPLASGIFGDGSTIPPPVDDGTLAIVARSIPETLRISGVEVGSMSHQRSFRHISDQLQFAANASAPRQTVLATREVIVTAGSLHSAQLLQLSGIGPESLLRAHDIPLAINLPGVGKNLQDHYLVGTFYPCTESGHPI